MAAAVIICVTRKTYDVLGLGPRWLVEDGLSPMIMQK